MQDAWRCGLLKGSRHLLMNSCLFIIISILDWLMGGGLPYVPLFIQTVAFGSTFPDWDQMVDRKTHRNWFTHSNIIAIILLPVCFFYNEMPFWFFLLTMISMHLVCDIKLKKDQRVGFYCIMKPNGRRMTGFNSTAWFFYNGITGVLVGIMGILFFV